MNTAVSLRLNLDKNMFCTFYINKKSATTIKNLSKTLLFYYLSA